MSKNCLSLRICLRRKKQNARIAITQIPKREPTTAAAMTPPEILFGVFTGAVADDPSDDVGCVCDSDSGVFAIPFSPVAPEINV